MGKSCSRLGLNQSLPPPFPYQQMAAHGCKRASPREAALLESCFHSSAGSVGLFLGCTRQNEAVHCFFRVVTTLVRGCANPRCSAESVLSSWTGLALVSPVGKDSSTAVRVLAESRESVWKWEGSLCKRLGKCEEDLSYSEKDTTEMAPGLENRVDVRYLQWLNGKLRFQWRSLHAQQQEQCKLLHKIHLFTSGSHTDRTLGHFSVTETDLVRHPENYNQLVQHLELETMQLEAFLEWKQLEVVYWQWMETVLDNMAEEGSVHSVQDTPVETSRLQEGATCCPWAESMTAQIDRLSGEMTALHSQLDKLVARRRSAWCQKVKTREEELQKEDFSAKLGKIEESVELKLLDLMNHSAPNRTRMHGSCRLVFRSKHSASKTGFGGSVSKEPAPAVSATEVIRELRMREASLQRELKQLQDECKQRLDGIAERLDGVICISP
ncbi:tubulin epsilon and delta complex protein 1 isoform X3 [Lagopus muta]|uniref:tubulin epsilon and delta complex protein 1 isoform X3 n=1 Tax=Lagopus muta TaxID=64668 RepID=UPI00209E0A91|nr:tubulin epsilon and delta complex protein 1 isoform X3 [Lagopus muta]